MSIDADEHPLELLPDQKDTLATTYQCTSCNKYFSFLRSRLVKLSGTEMPTSMKYAARYQKCEKVTSGRVDPQYEAKIDGIVEDTAVVPVTEERLFTAREVLTLQRIAWNEGNSAGRADLAFESLGGSADSHERSLYPRTNPYEV